MEFSINKSNQLVNKLLTHREDCDVRNYSFNMVKIDVLDNGAVCFDFYLETITLDRYQSYWGACKIQDLPNYWAKKLCVGTHRFDVEEIIKENKFLGYELRD